MRFNQWLWMLMRNWWSGPGSKIMQKYCFLVELEIVKVECVGRQGLLNLCVHLDYGYHIISKELSSLFIKFASVIVSEISWSGYAQLKRIMLWCRYAVPATRAVWIIRLGGGSSWYVYPPHKSHIIRHVACIVWVLRKIQYRYAFCIGWISNFGIIYEHVVKEL